MTNTVRSSICVGSLLLFGCGGEGPSTPPVGSPPPPASGGPSSPGGAAAPTGSPLLPAPGGGSGFAADSDWNVTKGLGNCGPGAGGAGTGGLWFATQADAEPMRFMVAETGEFRWLPSDGWFSLVMGHFEDHVTSLSTMGAIWAQVQGLTFLETTYWAVDLIANRAPTGDLALHYELQELPAASGTSELHSCRSVYERPSSLSILAGSYVNGSQTLVFDETGGVFYQSADTGCVGNGQAETIDERFNVYRLEIKLESCERSLYTSWNGRTFSGLGYLGDSSPAASNDVAEFSLSSIMSGHVDLWNLAARR